MLTILIILPLVVIVSGRQNLCIPLSMQSDWAWRSLLIEIKWFHGSSLTKPRKTTLLLLDFS